MSALIELRGAGGEPVDFARTVRSHGVAGLPPNVVGHDGEDFETVLPAPGGPWLVRLRAHATRDAVAEAHAPGAPPEALEALAATLRAMLRLDDDLSGFYAVAAADPALAWAAERGAGRLLRSPTVFEDVVKTICTTNCAWSATERMVRAIVGGLGEPAANAPHRPAFPSPEAMAAAPEAFYRDEARAGYRGAYLRDLAAGVAAGTLDLEGLADPALPDDEAAERLLGLPGVGPYAMAHVLMLLGRHRRLVLDSWMRPTYRRLAGRPRVTDKGIERAFRRYREHAGLAFWLSLTEDWVAQAD